jgi:lipopolysaccharide transport system permease protein
VGLARSASVERSADVVLALARGDLLARYGRGPLRAVKWLLDPFFLVGVYLLLVSFVIHRSGTALGLSLACAIVPFQLVILTVMNALMSVATRSSIIANMAFPRVLIPIASCVTETIGFASSLVLVVLMMAIYGVAPTVYVLWTPLLIAATILLAVAMAYPASLVGIWFPELYTLAVSAVRTLFFLAPGLVALAQVHGTAATLLRINPLSGLFEGFRASLLYGRTPAAWELLVPLAWAAVLLAVFVPLYRREQPQFAKLVVG